MKSFPFQSRARHASASATVGDRASEGVRPWDAARLNGISPLRKLPHYAPNSA